MKGRRTTARLTVIFLLIAACLLASTGYMDRYIGLAGKGALARHNDQFLSKTFERALHGFLILSGIKMVVAVIEGSEVGVGFSLQVGDVSQPAYDYVDIAWRTVLTGSVVLLMTGYFIDTASLIGPWFLTGTFALLLLFLLIAWYISFLQRIAYIVRGLLAVTLIITTALYLIFPISVAGGAYLSEKITQRSVDEAQNELDQVRVHLLGNSGVKNYDILPFESFQEKLSPAGPSITKRIPPRPGEKQEGQQSTGEEGVFNKAKSFKERIDYIVRYITDQSRELTIWVIRLIAGYIFDCIVFPYSIFIIMLFFVRSAIRYLLGYRERLTFREELERLARKYLQIKEPLATSDR
ncbi:MAG: hypothetical protein JW884_03980 [Deltaproteobacteria bacterium]|nr:hypothetical protein [Deltaproteobacteria bacterium]